jgi:hypothetical protein
MAKYPTGSKVGNLYRDDLFIGSCVTLEHATEIVQGMNELEELRRDRERLDWLEALINNGSANTIFTPIKGERGDIRKSIDAAIATGKTTEPGGEGK